MVSETTTVKDDLGNASGFRPLGDEGTHLDGALAVSPCNVGALLDGRGSDQGLAGRVVDELHADVLVGTEHGGTRYGCRTRDAETHTTVTPDTKYAS